MRPWQAWVLGPAWNHLTYATFYASCPDKPGRNDCFFFFFFSTVFLFSLFLLPRRPTLPLSRSVYWWTVVSQKTPRTLYTVNFHYLTNIIHLTITIRGETLERHKAKKSIPDTTSGREISRLSEENFLCPNVLSYLYAIPASQVRMQHETVKKNRYYHSIENEKLCIRWTHTNKNYSPVWIATWAAQPPPERSHSNQSKDTKNIVYRELLLPSN
jgi:hypothetical protein